jgi:gamma-glutamyltranspeptidase/glutathione hydrolase
VSVDRGDDETVRAEHGMVCSVDLLASRAGLDLLRAGGSAADAAIATNAVLAVTAQHLCGLGGDLFALVHEGNGMPACLVSAGPAGSGADASVLRAEGHRSIPRYGDIRAVTVPGCVDGWMALHERYGRLPMARLLEPARDLAASGFEASSAVAAAAARISEVPLADDYRRPGRGLGGNGALRAGDEVRRPLVADTLHAIATDGRDGFYRGTFGDALLALGRAPARSSGRSPARSSGRSSDGKPESWSLTSRDLFTDQDLSTPIARWVEPIGLRAWGHDIWTAPPPSQGYLLPSSAWIADGLDIPSDPDDPAWPHLLSESARWAGFDRPAVLHDGADAGALLAVERLTPRRAAIRRDARTAPPAPAAAGGTTYLCVVDDTGLAVSLIQSNAAGWGAGIVAPGTGVFLQNRGLGFSLEPGHPAELAPGRRPPHTLVPVVVTRPDGGLAALLGTMGGDTQPQILLQLLARLLVAHQSPGQAVAASRWFLGEGGFDTWAGDGPQLTTLEPGAPASWAPGLAARGHRLGSVATRSVGHAQVIVRASEGPAGGWRAGDGPAGDGPAGDGPAGDGRWAGASDPRVATGAALAW